MVLMPRYIVDLRSLEPEERDAAFILLRDYSFLAARIMGKSGLEGADVIWDSQQDFQTSPIYPKGCPCRLEAY